MTVETFDEPGDGTWPCPEGITVLVVELWGGGGGGGDNDGGADGPGGGGGAYARVTLAVVPTTVYDYHVGAGGAPATNGEGSWFDNPETAYADPGVAGGTGLGQGGQAVFSIGDVLFSGGSAGSVLGISGAGASGGGSSAGPASNGNSSANATGNAGTAGGAAVADGGAGGNGGGTTPLTSAQAGFAPGGGAGGSSVGAAAFSGAAGRVRLTYGDPEPVVPDWYRLLPAGGPTMKQTAASMQAWLTTITDTGNLYDPADTYVGVATAVDDQGQATALADVTQATGASATRVLITAWSDPYPMEDGRWAVDGPIAQFQQGGGDDAQTITNWFLADAATLGVLKAWGTVDPPRTLLPDGAIFSIVVRLTIDPDGRFSQEVYWNG